MEISYTKQQQKQKQKQQNKNQDSDMMDIFNKNDQIELWIDCNNYFEYTLTPHTDMPRIMFNLPIPFPVLSFTYADSTSEGSRKSVNVYPTLMFLYSHHTLRAASVLLYIYHRDATLARAAFHH